MDDEPEENKAKEKVGEENVPLVEEIQVPSGRCLVEEERRAGGQKRTEAWILETSLYKGSINFSKSSSYIFKNGVKNGGEGVNFSNAVIKQELIHIATPKQMPRGVQNMVTWLRILKSAKELSQKLPKIPQKHTFQRDAHSRLSISLLEVRDGVK